MEGLNGMLLNCHMYQFPILGNKGKNPNSKEKLFTYQRLMCDEFLIYLIYFKRYTLSKVLFAISFPKIDKDLKTGF